MTAPQAGTEARRWWDQGTVDETAARDEGLNAKVREARDCLESLARIKPPECQDTAQLAVSLAAIYTAGLPRRARIRFALELVRR